MDKENVRMISSDLFYKKRISFFLGKTSCETLAGKRTALHHNISIAESLHIMAKSQQAFDPHSRLNMNRPWQLVFKISYYEYSFGFLHSNF
jgi:hypothetical protein